MDWQELFYSNIQIEEPVSGNGNLRKSLWLVLRLSYLHYTIDNWWIFKQQKKRENEGTHKSKGYLNAIEQGNSVSILKDNPKEANPERTLVTKSTRNRPGWPQRRRQMASIGIGTTERRQRATQRRCRPIDNGVRRLPVKEVPLCRRRRRPTQLDRPAWWFFLFRFTQPREFTQHLTVPVRSHTAEDLLKQIPRKCMVFNDCERQ